MYEHVLKHGHYFLIATKSGNVPPDVAADVPGDASGSASDGTPKAYGLYMGDTRVLSHYVFRLEPGPLHVTASSMNGGDSGRIVMLADTLTSLDSPPREVVVERRPLIRDGFIEHITVTNYGHEPCRLHLALDAAADFRDIFEVRGMQRDRRGRTFPVAARADGATFHYRGLDEMDYVTDVRFSPDPSAISAVTVSESEWEEPNDLTTVQTTGGHRVSGSDGGDVDGLATAGDSGNPTVPPNPASPPEMARASYRLVLQPGEEFAFEVSVVSAARPVGNGERDAVGAKAADNAKDADDANDAHAVQSARDFRHRPHAAALLASRLEWQAWSQDAAFWHTDHATVNDVLDRSFRDVRVLLTDFGHGAMPVAGIPWYAAPFGRDSLITAIQTLSVQPDITAATLRTLAAWQGTRLDHEYDEAPGKIMHELRRGEMARMREIPFVPYYGSVDATPLFVITAGEYWRWTDDRELMKELLPALHAAVRWMDENGDKDGDGYIEYHRRRAGGLVNQGWKDSTDGIVHRDGPSARPPIALAEVQSYAYAARRCFADILEALGDLNGATEQRRRAEALKTAFNEDFWIDETGFYAMALDGEKRPVAAVSSNPGHGLWTGIIADDRIDAAAERLLAEDMFTGYGIRTLSAAERAYHPLSYHRGSVWPHDNSLIAMGLARCGHGEMAGRIATGLFAAASFETNRRLPELFGGYPADLHGPVWYPVACSPQAWAAAAPFLLLQSVLGLEPDAPNNRLTLSPHLPPGINRVSAFNVRLGPRRVRIEVQRRGDRDGYECNVDVLSGPPLDVVVGS